MTREDVLGKLEENIDYIPTREDYILIRDIPLDQINVGAPPVFRIDLVNRDEDIHKMLDIDKASRNKRPEGLSELFRSLEIYGYCSSYHESIAYFMAYLMASHNIDVIINGFEYKSKRNNKKLKDEFIAINIVQFPAEK